MLVLEIARNSPGSSNRANGLHEDGHSKNSSQYVSSSSCTAPPRADQSLKPARLYFYEYAFRHMGSRNDFEACLIDITGIEGSHNCFPSASHALSMPFAQKMQWASLRKTTRKEDRAYCLLGICGVNMPLLYGEGRQKAFVRLQLE